MSNTAVIVVNYNKKQLLRDCLSSLRKAVDSEDGIFVVDNGSDDGSLEMLKTDFTDVFVIEMGYNSGFCKANNVGMKQAINQEFENIILLNNDTTVDQNFVESMCNALDEKEKIGMVAAQILLMKKPEQLDSAGISVTPDGLGKNRGHGEHKKAYQEKSEVFCPAGAAALYTKNLLLDIIQEGKFLDEDYKFYLEELDLGWRARLRGWKCVYQPKAVVLHLKRATSDQFAEKMIYYANRNIYYNIIKNYPSFFLIFKAIMLSIVRNCLLFFGSLLGKGVVGQRKQQVGVLGMFRIYIKGVYTVLWELKKLLKKRRYIQKRRTIGHVQAKKIFNELGFGFFESIFKL